MALSLGIKPCFRPFGISTVVERSLLGYLWQLSIGFNSSFAPLNIRQDGIMNVIDRIIDVSSTNQQKIVINKTKNLANEISKTFYTRFFPTYTTPVEHVDQMIPSITGNIQELSGIFLIKRTFQPSLIRRKRKHGFLARVKSKTGIKILHRRWRKKRRSVSA